MEEPVPSQPLAGAPTAESIALQAENDRLRAELESYQSGAVQQAQYDEDQKAAPVEPPHVFGTLALEDGTFFQVEKVLSGGAADGRSTLTVAGSHLEASAPHSLV